MQLFLEIPNDVLEFREIFRGRLDQGLVSFQHRLRPSGAVFFQQYWKSLPVLFYGAHAYVQKLVQPQATQGFRVSLIEIDDRQRAFAQLAKPQRDPSERAHKCRIHHRTIAQIDDELAGTGDGSSPWQSLSEPCCLWTNRFPPPEPKRCDPHNLPIFPIPVSSLCLTWSVAAAPKQATLLLPRPGLR